MPVGLPSEADERRDPPDIDEVFLLSRGITSAVAPPGGLTELQRVFLASLFDAMTGHPVVLDAPSIEPEAFAECFATRNAMFRGRIVQNMVLTALILRPLPRAVADRVCAFARELSVDEGMLTIAQEFAAGSLGIAAVDFERNGYTAHWSAEDAAALHASKSPQSPWEAVVHDDALAARWQALEDLPEGTLGRRTTEFYRARGFVYPGHRGSAPPLLAQHDWVHVLGDYGSTVESELEVFALIARATDDLRGFSLLAMVISLFETGYLRTGAGLFEYSQGHLALPGVATRVAHAMRRGALCEGSIDFLRTDWFAIADLHVDEARARFGLPPKSIESIAAGSVGPWDRGGISAFQARAGVALAESQGRPYDTYGAEAATSG
jgi:hypothetical protein